MRRCSLKIIWENSKRNALISAANGIIHLQRPGHKDKADEGVWQVQIG